MKLGIGSYAYMWSIGFEGAVPANPLTTSGLLAKARELAVRVVQIGPNMPLDRLTESELDEAAAQAHEWGIEMEIGTRGLDLEHLTRQVAIAQRFGATLLRTIPEVNGGRVPTISELSRLLCTALPVLAGSGVRLAIENGKIPAVDLANVLDNFGSKWLGVTLDTVNSLAIPEDWKHVARTLARHTMCLHLKDFIVRRVWHMMGFTVQGQPAGKGQVDFPWLLETLEDAGVSPNVILELWPPEEKRLEDTIRTEQAWAVESIKYLRAYVPE
jgi:sugar phosphate isomerase/epimerase